MRNFVYWVNNLIGEICNEFDILLEFAWVFQFQVSRKEHFKPRSAYLKTERLETRVFVFNDFLLVSLTYLGLYSEIFVFRLPVKKM